MCGNMHRSIIKAKEKENSDELRSEYEKEYILLKPNDIMNIVREYKNKLAAVLGNQLVDVLLYGSQARKTAEEFSDIDVLCILRPPFDYGEMIRRTSEITAKLSLNYDVVLSRVFISEQNYKTGDLPFFMNVRREGIAL